MRLSAKALLPILFLFAFFASKAQEQYTPYDDIPGVNKNYKPSYNPNYPDWAKMLYQYPVNFNSIKKDFDSWMENHAGEKSPIIRYFKLWSRAIGSYVDPGGIIELPDNDLYYKNLKSAQLNAGKLLKSASAAASDWTFLGPKETFWLNESNDETTPNACPWQVNVYSFDVAPSDNNILYCGTETGFVNKTTDKGLSWKLLVQNYPFGGAVTAVAINPVNPDIVYVSAGNQVHKTINGGIGWSPVLTNLLFRADRLKIDPNNPEKIAAAANDGVYLSLNGGVSWSKKWSYQAWDIEFKPNDSNTILAVTKDANNAFKVISSSSGGESFSIITNFPSYKNDSGALLAMTPANPSIVYVSMLCTEGSETVPYIVKGTFANNTWTWKQTKKGQYGSVGGLGGFTNGQGYFDLVLEVSPKNENLLFFGTCSLWKSVDGGVNFIGIGGYNGNFPIHPDQQDMKILPSGETWLATDGGMTISTDDFTNKSNASARINGLVGSDMWGFDQGWNEDIIVGGRFHNGNTAIADFYQSKALRMGGAESPTGWVVQGKSRHVAFSDLGNGWILPKTSTGAPEGRFIFSKFPNMDGYGSRLGNILYHPNYSGTLFVGEGTSIWKSTDSGVSYDLLYGFPDKVRYMQISYSNPNVIYADVDNKGLYQTTDGGKSWTLKNSLTAEGGRSGWKGRMFFAISPYNENFIYACYQNDAWSSNTSSIMRSTDGGTTWNDWTGSVSGFSKCISIQPSKIGNDVVYLFTTSQNGEPAKVFLRTSEMADWEPFSTNYPAGMSVHLALPFFRDSKIRVSGNGGVWESPLAEPEYEPIINPWIEKQKYNCFLDTVYFDDHSILNHEGAQWKWEISPAPRYISSENIRNPKVVFGKAGSYQVKITVTKKGKTYSKTIDNMVSLTICPSLTDCSNPAELPKKEWKLVYVDSQDVGSGGSAEKAFDGDPSTIWHTRWSTGTDRYPHEIQIDMSKSYNIHKFIYLPRADGENGRIKKYELYLSNDKTQWGTAVKTGEFTNIAAPQSISFDNPKPGRYFRLKTLSEVNGGAWSSAAEFTLIGCNTISTGIDATELESTIAAYPIPANDLLNISLPSESGFRYSVFSSSGELIEEGSIDPNQKIYSFKVLNYGRGLFLIRLVDKAGVVFRVKIIKQ